MAHFIGYVQGNRNIVSRLGHASSGIRAQAQGWDVGIKISGGVDDNGNDVFHVYATKGSSGGIGSHLIATVTKEIAKLYDAEGNEK